MIGFAAYEVRARQIRTFAGIWTYGIGGGSMVVAGVTVTVLALTT